MLLDEDDETVLTTFHFTVRHGDQNVFAAVAHLLVEFQKEIIG